MRVLAVVASLLLFACSAQAQTSFVRNDSGATAINGSNKYSAQAGVNQYGDLATKPFGAERSDYFSLCNASDITDTTATTVAAAGGAGVKRYITSLSVTNLHATVNTRVDLLDGSTVVDYCAAASAGGGCTKSYPIPIAGTANTAVKCQPGTTGAAVRCCVQGFTSSR